MTPYDSNGLPGPFIHTDLGLTRYHLSRGILAFGIAVGLVLIVVLLAPRPARLPAPFAAAPAPPSSEAARNAPPPQFSSTESGRLAETRSELPAR